MQETTEAMVECLHECIRPPALATPTGVEVMCSPVDAKRTDDNAALCVLYGSSSARIGGGIRQEDDDRRRHDAAAAERVGRSSFASAGRGVTFADVGGERAGRRRLSME